MATRFDAKTLEDALATLGEVLDARGERFELVAIGGAGLLLLGAIARPTKDLDVVARIEAGAMVSALPLPDALRDAVRDVARDIGADDDWVNGAPTDLLRLGLPEGFARRLSRRAYGGLIVHVAGREDQIAFKLYAASDQHGRKTRHHEDLERLRPSAAELIAAARWTRTHDPSDGFRLVLGATLKQFGVEVPDDL